MPRVCRRHDQQATRGASGRTAEPPRRPLAPAPSGRSSVLRVTQHGIAESTCQHVFDTLRSARRWFTGEVTRGGAPTRAGRVYAELRADILGGRQRPGARLPFGELTARCGASRGGVREPLSRLPAEGLVEAEPQFGFRVVPLSIADLKHLTDAR